MNSVKFATKLLVCANVRRAIQALFAAIGLFLICPSLFGQLNTGRISGALTDQTGGAISGAKITVTEIATGVARSLTTDSSGQYAAPNLNPGTYTLRAEFTGFQTLERQNIQVGAGSDVRVDVTLQPGQQNQTVTVTESLPQINTTNAQTGGTLENNMITNIPLNGRNYRWMVEYVPGIMTQPGEGTSNTSVNGGGTNWANFMVDGLYDQAMYADQSTANAPGEAGDTTIIPLDAVQEVALVSNPKAEYGWNPGVTMNVALKSGSNNIHGSAFAFGRDQDLDAKNNFAATRPPTSFEQWGGSFGGPLKKDKVFYFAGYESVRLDVTNDFALNNSVPSQSASVSSTSLGIPAAIAGVETAGLTPNQLSLNILGCGTAASYAGKTTPAAVGSCTVNPQGAGSLYSASTGCTLTAPNSNSENCSFPQYGGSDNFVGKIDYHINDHHALNGSYFFGRYHEYADGSTAVTQPYWDEILAVRSQMARLVEIWTPNSSWLNEVRVGWDHASRPVSMADCSANGSTTDPLGLTSQSGQFGAPNYATAYGLNTGTSVCGMPTLKLSKLATLSFGNDRLSLETDYQASDNVSYTRGTHQFKFGVDARFPSFSGVKVQDQQKGTVTFGASGAAAFANATALEDFVAGDPSSETIKLGNPIRTVRWDMIALFAQDDWRIVPRITLNLGLRWELETPNRDDGGQLANFDSAAPSGMIQNNQLWPVQSDFSPHFGVAWDVTGKGTTTVRSSVGVAYVVPKLMGWITAQSDDLSAMPTAATLFYGNGTAEQTHGVNTVGNITNMLVSPTAVSNGTIITSETLPWGVGPGTTLFNTNLFQCGDGLGSINPLGTPTGPGGANPVNASTCTGYGANSNFHLPQVITWNLNVQHALTRSLSLDVGYVGTHASSIAELMDLNQPSPGTTSFEQTRRPFYANCSVANGGPGTGPNPSQCFPWFSQILSNQNSVSNNYNGLQIYLNQRPTHGFTYTVGYTFSHALGVDSGGETSGLIMNTGCPKCEYGSLATDARNHFTITGTYQIPGRRFPGQLLQGWSINSSVNILSALPLNAIDSTDDVSGTGTNLDRWSLYGPAAPFNEIMGGAGLLPCFTVAANAGLGVKAGKFSSASNCIQVPATSAATPWSNMPTPCIAAATAEPSFPGAPAGTAGTGLGQLAAIGCYMINGSAIVAPAQGTFGNMTRNELRGKGFRGWNASITKDWKFKERFDAQFRAEAFNLLNRTQYAGVGLNLGAPNTFGEATQTPDVAKSNPVIGSGGPREIQLGLKLTF